MLPFLISQAAKSKLKSKRKAPKSKPKTQQTLDHQRGVCATCCRAVCGLLCPCCLFNTKFKSALCKRGTLANEIAGNIIGFVCGLVISVLFYAMMVFQMALHPLAACVFSGLLSLPLSLGLAFSPLCRCLTLLALPTLCSSKGRNLLLVFAMLMVATHVVTNVSTNMERAAESLSCGHQVANDAVRAAMDEAASPIYAFLEHLRQVINHLVTFAAKVREAFDAIREGFMEILAAIQRAAGWILHAVDVCNERIGDPYRKCVAAFNYAVDDCRAKLGQHSPLCEIPAGFRPVCNIVRIGELLCHLTERVKTMVVEKVRGLLLRALDDVYDMFYFNVTLHHTYHLQVNQSRSYEEVKRAVLDEIRVKLQPLKTASRFASLVFFVTFCIMIFRTLLYRHRYLCKNNYDNIYLTWQFYQIDARRRRKGKASILPLTLREKRRYVDSDSLRLVKAERTKLTIGIILLLGSAIYTGFYLLCDYGIFWLLDTLSRGLRDLHLNIRNPNKVSLHVEGKGVMADMYRVMLSAFDTLMRGDVTHGMRTCIVIPSEPRFDIYKLVGGVYAACFILVLTEAYGLRLRHVIVGCYYPERGRQRAAALYSTLMAGRRSFLPKFADILAGNHQARCIEQKTSFIEYLSARSSTFRRLASMLGFKRKYCVSCAVSGHPDDMKGFQHCPNDNCQAVYCIGCFYDINNHCIICTRSVNLDLSSEEKDSSDEEESEGNKTGHCLSENDVIAWSRFQVVERQQQRDYISSEDGKDTDFVTGDRHMTMLTNDLGDNDNRDRGHSVWSESASDDSDDLLDYSSTSDNDMLAFSEDDLSDRDPE